MTSTVKNQQHAYVYQADVHKVFPDSSIFALAAIPGTRVEVPKPRVN